MIGRLEIYASQYVSQYVSQLSVSIIISRIFMQTNQIRQRYLRRAVVGCEEMC